MPMLVAEELECDWQKVRAEYARPTAACGRTVSISAWRPAAAGCTALARVPAAGWGQRQGPPDRGRGTTVGVPPASAGRSREQSSIRVGSQAQLRGASRRRGQVKLDAEPAIKTPDQFTLLGQSLNRLDAPEGQRQRHLWHRRALAGHAVCLGDDLPGVRGTLKRYDFEAIKSLPGVRTAVEVPNGIAVVADSFWRAKTGARGHAH